MDKNIIRWSLIVLLAAFGAACNDNDSNESVGNGKPGEELKPVVLPAHPRVANLVDVSAVLVWEGGSTEYEVEMNSEVLPTKSISYGLKGLTPETTYSWKVRSKEGERYSEWVNGPDFTTLRLVDKTEGWPGEWQASDFKLTLIVADMGVDADAFLPDGALNPKIDVTIEKKPETIDRILFSSPRLEEISPAFKKIEAQVTDNQMSVLNNLTDTLVAELEYPLSIENLPEKISEIVLKFIEELPTFGEEIKDIKINKLGIILEDMNLRGELKEKDVMPVNFSVSGKFLLETDNTLVNTLLKFLTLSASLDAGMTLYPKQ